MSATPQQHTLAPNNANSSNIVDHSLSGNSQQPQFGNASNAIDPVTTLRQRQALGSDEPADLSERGDPVSAPPATYQRGDATPTPYPLDLPGIPEKSTPSSNPADPIHTPNAIPSAEAAAKPFFIRWTVYRLCNAFIMLGIVIPKAIEGFQDHNLTAGVLDAVLGVLGVIFWLLEKYSDDHDGAYPWFFKTDFGAIMWPHTATLITFVWQRIAELITFVFTHPAAPRVMFFVLCITALAALVVSALTWHASFYQWDQNAVDLVKMFSTSWGIFGVTTSITGIALLSNSEKPQPDGSDGTSSWMSRMSKKENRADVAFTMFGIVIAVMYGALRVYAATW